MPTRTSVNRFPHSHICAALVLLAVGCSKADAPPKGTGGGATLPGTLAKSLDSYTGEELYAFVHGLSFTADSVKDRKCKGSPACGSAPNPKKIKVAVSAVNGQDSLSAGTTPHFGVVYVRAINRGDAAEARYDMKPGKQFEYYLVVLPDSTGGMRWRLEELDTTAGARRHASIGTGAFKGCDHQWYKGAAASFKSCQTAAAAHASTAKLGLMQQDATSDVDPFWANCALGCCVSET
jgi:hypothetical protein